jgi:alcohol dehydrogenase class IV
MQELRKFVAPEFIFGRGATALVGRYAANFGARRPLVVTDPGVIAAGPTRAVIGQLEAEGLEYAIFSEVSQNPRDGQVRSGARIYADNGCDVIVAVGGGSPMDCAKGIGILATNHGQIVDYEGVDNVPVPGPPLICVPTTAGSSADVSQFAIINDTARQLKFAIVSKTMVPDVALIDPAMTMTMDPYLTACTGMDALVHAIEAVVSTASSPITDIHAFQAIRLVRRNLEASISAPDDPEARDGMMLGSLEAGLAFSNASLGAVHAMAHSLGGLMDMPHGECNAILLSPVISWNFEAAPDRYREIAVSLGLDVAGKSDEFVLRSLLDDIAYLRDHVGITAGLGYRGTSSDVIPQLARNAINDPCMVTNPRVPTLHDIEAIYAAAM